MNAQMLRFLLGATIASVIALTLFGSLVESVTHAEAPLPFSGVDVQVDTTADQYSGVGCSLRDAIQTINNGANHGGCMRISNLTAFDKVLLPSGTYSLTISGAGEDFNVTGDLDIRRSMIISATGAPMPMVLGGAGWDDRVFHIITGTVGSVAIKGITISGGSEPGDGGGGIRIESGTSLTLNDSNVFSNTTGDIGFGGGIFNNGTLSLNSSIVVRNTAGGGGGIFNNGTLSLINSILVSNTAAYGGGILNYHVLMLTNVTLSGNSSSGLGGGIGGAGTMILTNVTLSGNSASTYGGGISLGGGGTMTLTNVTLSGNSANFDGGGINNADGAATLTNVTLNGNSAMQLGGGINTSNAMTLANTIVANSSSGGNCNMALGGNTNLSSDTTCHFGTGRENRNVMLAPLGNYGGSTLTQIPYGGSPAIDTGDNLACPSSDQRGKPRPVHTCDVGAVERQPIDFPFFYLPLILK